MELIIGFIFIGAFIKMLRRAGQAARSKPRRASYAPPPPVKTAPPKASPDALAALDDAKQALLNQLDIVSAILDTAPPEKQRIQLLQQQATIYNQLANIESKIHKARN